MPRKAAVRAFDLGRFLQAAGRSVRYERGQVIFSQGEPCINVLYLQRGAVRLSLLSPAGKEAVLATSAIETSSARDAFPDNRSGWRRQSRQATFSSGRRARVNFFMNKFRKLGFIDYDADGVMVHPSLVSVVLHE
jgi:cyclic nucleotide-binding protein